MIDTLLKLGEQLSGNSSKWGDRLEKRESKLYQDDKKREKKLYVLNIVFDVDNETIIVSPENLEQFTENDSISRHWLLQTMGANAGKTYVAALLDNLEHLAMSLIGKTDKNNAGLTLDGDFLNDIKKNFPEIKSTTFYNALNSLKIFKKNSVVLEKEYVLKQIGINRASEAIIFCYASIKNSELNTTETIELSKLEGFETYMNTRFFKPILTDKQTNQKLCYASGHAKPDVEVSSYMQRGLINAMFVQETKNYANNFEKSNFNKNYQISKENGQFIERAAFFLKNNFTVRIADIVHIIVPEFLSKTQIDLKSVLEKVKSQSDFLFKYNELKKLDINITDETDDTPYWINYLAVETDGNYFKTSELIKDVSKPYFLTILKTIEEVNYELQTSLNNNSFLNLYSIYTYIPVKNDLKNNAALVLFKDIFEHRPIDKQQLFKHFSKYLICQRSGQFDKSKKHRAYANIREQTNFDYAISNAVNTYLTFFEILKKLNLLNHNNMDGNNEVVQQIETTTNDYGKSIETFFVKMEYTEQQRALFYLGRVLSNVAYAQYQKSHKNKPVLNKINYNGMDNEKIIRLRVDLAEKARQYNIVNKVEFNFSRFTDLFNPKHKHLSPNENVFYILSGYSFGISKSEPSSEKTSIEE